MNMERTKNILIIFFIIINLSLSLMVYASKRENHLTEQEKNAIIMLLQKNQISMYTFPLTDYNPRKQMRIAPYYFTVENAIATFFGNSDGVTTTEEFGQIKYHKDGKSLTLNQNNVIFENPEGTGPVNLTNTDVYALCDSFMKLLPLENAKYIQDQQQTPAGSQWTIEYRLQYKNSIIYSSYVRFTVTEKGIIRVRCSLAQPIGYVGDPRPIYSPDEALFRLMYRLKSDYGDPENNETIRILQMDIVYVRDEPVANGEEFFDITPYYRFYIRLENAGTIRTEPYLINAYNNTFLD